MHDIDMELKLMLDGKFNEARAISDKLEKLGPKGIPDPEISLSIKRGGNKKYILQLSDNGKGFDPGKSNNETLGLLLIDSLANQLDGTMALTSGSEGTAYSLEF